VILGDEIAICCHKITFWYDKIVINRKEIAKNSRDRLTGGLALLRNAASLPYTAAFLPYTAAFLPYM